MENKILHILDKADKLKRSATEKERKEKGHKQGFFWQFSYSLFTWAVEFNSQQVQ